MYLKTFILRPKIMSTLIFFPFLYLLGFILASPLILLGVEKENISLIGTFITFLIFVFSLPKWFEIRWKLNNVWKIVGIKKTNRNRKLSFYFLKGLLGAISLLAAILIPIILFKGGIWLGEISINILINSLLLIFGVGFAEELIFRGWLLEELKNQFGLNKALIIQSLIFSLVHIGFNLPFWQMVSILSGLFLLGIFLAFMRLKNNNSLWGCVGLHGGLVGGWFLVNNGLFEISKDVPIWLVGPGNINTNPIGGFWGISLLFFLCFIYFFILKKNQKFN
jgi:membrane protease YdiL (CAAX protease family)